MKSYFALLAASWVAVDPSNAVRLQVPEFTYAGIPGSVTDQYRRKQEAADGCPIHDNGKLIGWSLNCFPTPSGAEHAERFY